MENGKIILKDIPFKVDLYSIVKTCAAEEDDELVAEIAEFAEKAEKLASPKAILKLVDITHSEEKVTAIAGIPCNDSVVLNNNLKNIERAVAYVVTCGTELDAVDTEYDPLKEYWLDLIKLQALGTSRKCATDKIKEILGTEKVAHLNPGSLPQWPISEQQSLFEYIGEVSENIGVTLGSSYLMTPLKSGSGIAFTTEVHYENCMACTKLNCPNRRAPFNEKMAEEYGTGNCSNNM
ncbi:MAG: hypothetical protein J6M16_00605 [Clostridia bacterium]|nr:hypothetical protein [Clostridia bacterium]